MLVLQVAFSCFYAEVIVLTISTALPTLQPPKCTIVDSPTCISVTATQLIVLYIAFYLTALGISGLKSSVSGFGSDQFDDTDEQEKNQMTKFFSWFFFFINIGSLMAVTVLVYIQGNLGRQWGYRICACAIVISHVLFLSGIVKYQYKKLVGSSLTHITVVFVATERKKGVELP
ncbi:Protein NRT1/ PTR FAMILY 6.3 [Camellia lanceoleosa]|uniref:Protein NRT1/ PTR FAMILY 6.3 n=1 Tax=Camellia lanceoleosa TaxID=1840588 RepID=A0ACC0G0N2_9ERIC|nr:Protein NRT1/ PTR FAMILY 6.3 [Camellia lanceoleosa]